jgi:hypothetical protein
MTPRNLHGMFPVKYQLTQEMVNQTCKYYIQVNRNVIRIKSGKIKGRINSEIFSCISYTIQFKYFALFYC